MNASVHYLPGSEPFEPWDPPETFRATLTDVVRLADLLVEHVDNVGALLVTVDDVRLMTRRTRQAAIQALAALPPEVS